MKFANFMTSPINYIDPTGHIQVEAAVSRYGEGAGMYCGVGQNTVYKATEKEYDYQLEMHNDIVDSHDENDMPQPTTYYVDFTINIFFLSIGRTKLINLEEKYVSYHPHAGLNLSLGFLPISAKSTTGVVTGDTSVSSNYKDFFLEGSLAAATTAEGALGVEFTKEYWQDYFSGELSEDTIQQAGGGITTNASVSGGISYYWQGRSVNIYD